jgi:hypothetical protein
MWLFSFLLSFLTSPGRCALCLPSALDSLLERVFSSVVVNLADVEKMTSTWNLERPCSSDQDGPRCGRFLGGSKSDSATLGSGVLREIMGDDYAADSFVRVLSSLLSVAGSFPTEEEVAKDVLALKEEVNARHLFLEGRLLLPVPSLTARVPPRYSAGLPRSLELHWQGWVVNEGMLAMVGDVASVGTATNSMSVHSLRLRRIWHRGSLPSYLLVVGRFRREQVWLREIVLDSPGYPSQCGVGSMVYAQWRGNANSESHKYAEFVGVVVFADALSLTLDWTDSDRTYRNEHMFMPKRKKGSLYQIRKVRPRINLC